MNIVREFVEGSYTNFKTELDISGLDLAIIPIIIVAIAFVCGAGYTIARTLTQIHINNNTFTQRNFLIGCGYFGLATFNTWAVMYMDLVLEWYNLMPWEARALSIVWFVPAIAGLAYFERWRNSNLSVAKTGIRKLPEWVVPIGMIVVTALILFGLIVASIELNMAMDCQRIGTSEESTLTEQEAIDYRGACESTIDHSYVFEFVVLPVMALAMVGYMIFVLKPMKEGDDKIE